MRFIVLIKQVPDTAEVNVDPATGHLVREGVSSILNPEDRHALEAALQCAGQGDQVVAMTMGPTQAVDVLSEALGMGAHRGVLLSDRFFAGADTWATSYTLGKAIEHLGPFDLVLCGRQAIDGDTAQIGPQVAEHLGIPQVTYVTALRIEDGRVRATRDLGGTLEEVEAPLPALVTVLASCNRPRYPELRKLLAACEARAPIQLLDAADIGVMADHSGLRGSYTRVVKTFAPKVGRETTVIEGSATEMAGRLVAALREKNVL
ncbi:MAG: electron transfer flavoprotein subunit beta/FixA family protein [Planctomycetes bacterium]|nr:electron transfer flavoprotein subunit beta/FixA family protein [Planctomycetota bacterium]